MDGLALKNEECVKATETYNVEKEKVSEMAILLNNVEYEKKSNVLYRKDENENYKVRLHFQEDGVDIMKIVQKKLKESYIQNYKKEIGEKDV